MEGGMVAFKCPGCGDMHALRVEGDVRPKWSYNGNPDAPTFTPSIDYKTGHFCKDHSGECWCTWKDEDGKASGFDCIHCHSFVTDGRIQFLNDCSHALAGQTVDLPEIAT
tara:strand:- start:26651 stop:26980 length:330 start_codon:yes stop_codon:yes gene_type:complete